MIQTPDQVIAEQAARIAELEQALTEIAAGTFRVDWNRAARRALGRYATERTVELIRAYAKEAGAQ
jgi:hypothetical protein